MGEVNVLEARGVSKSYPGVQALDAVDFDLRAGEVHALVGQNGAGKSTFIEIVAGSLQPDSGRLSVGGTTVPHLDPPRSIELGIQTVHQENQLVEELSVAENIYLYNLPRSAFGFVDRAAAAKAATALLSGLGIAIDPNRKLADLTFIEKKLVSIAKACSRQARILILDEPTASLDEKGRDILFALIRRSTASGLGVIYISHNLGEIFEVCDRVTVFKDGRLVSTAAVRETDMGSIVRQMIGRSSSSLYARTRACLAENCPVVLEVDGYARAGKVHDVSFGVRAGEIFGIAGLVGAGRTELARMIFGLEAKDAGAVRFKGEDLTPRDPADAIRKGIGYLTEDRKAQGLALRMSLGENVLSAVIPRHCRRGVYLPGRGAGLLARLVGMLDIHPAEPRRPVGTLSGGNQQKALLAKWLAAGPRVLVLDEPTRGVDVGAKVVIHRAIAERADAGTSVVLISSDLPELVGLSDRIAILRRGHLIGQIARADATEAAVLLAANGEGPWVRP